MLEIEILSHMDLSLEFKVNAALSLEVCASFSSEA